MKKLLLKIKGLFHAKKAEKELNKNPDVEDFTSKWVHEWNDNADAIAFAVQQLLKNEKK